MDGIDLAVIRTDGTLMKERHGGTSVPYPDETRAAIEAALGQAAQLGRITSDLDALSMHITQLHRDAVEQYLKSWNGPALDVIGFHGHTVLHRPQDHLTWQIGDGAALAQMTSLPVVWDFRSHDVALGGEGAPLACAYHQAIASTLKAQKPMAVLNLGGVANVTYIAPEGDMLAMDCGPANALMDMWMAQHSDALFDEGGRIAAQGAPVMAIISQMAEHPYLVAPPPKSLDRLDFGLEPVKGLSFEDGMATLAAFTAECVRLSEKHFPQEVARWLVTGGGRHNDTLMAMLDTALNGQVEPIEAAGFDGDLLEAEAFAYLAVRSLYGQALSYPGTTGVPEPATGGRVSRP